MSKALPSPPIISVRVCGRTLHALVDSGCTKSAIVYRVVSEMPVCLSRISQRVCMLDGSSTVCNYEGSVCVHMSSGALEVELSCLVVDELVTECDMVLGMDCITQLGGVFIDGAGVRFGGPELGGRNLQTPTPTGVVGNCAVVCDGDKERHVVIHDQDSASPVCADATVARSDGDPTLEGCVSSGLESVGAVAECNVRKQSLEVNDQDFRAWFNGDGWYVEW